MMKRGHNVELAQAGRSPSATAGVGCQAVIRHSLTRNRRRSMERVAGSLICGVGVTVCSVTVIGGSLPPNVVGMEPFAAVETFARGTRFGGASPPLRIEIARAGRGECLAGGFDRLMGEA